MHQAVIHSTSGLWNAGSIAAGGSVSVNIVATVNPTGNYTNVAEVTASNTADPDSTPGNNVPSEDDQASETINPIAVSDLSLTMSIDQPNPIMGSTVVFTINMQNAGPSTATGMDILSLLPSGYTYISDDAAGNYNNTTGLWTVSSLNSGSVASINIRATVNFTGNYNATAEVMAADNQDPDSTPGNGVVTEDDYASITSNPLAVSDLEVSMSVTNPTPMVGSNITFTVNVTNNGPSAATGVTVADLLPNGFTYISDNAGGNYNAVTGIWTVSSLASGSSASMQINVLVNPTGAYTNVAEIMTSNNFDPDSTPGNGVVTEDDYASVTVNPVPVADLSLTQSVNDLNPTTGDTVIFTLTIQNNGPSAATGVNLENVVPSGYGNITPITSGSTLNGNTLNWNGLTIAGGSSVQLQFSAVVLTTGTYFNSAEITASDVLDPDSDPAQSFDVDDLNDGIADDDESVLNNIVVNFLPVAVNDEVLLVENIANQAIYVLTDNGFGADDFGGDGPASMAIVISVAPTHGTAVVNNNGTPNNQTDDYVLYTPNANYVGIDTFSYTIQDSNGDTSTAVVNIEVLVDTDGDRVPDRRDIDDDNDGILDTTESVTDIDQDSYGNSLDIDADGDGIPDNVEAQTTGGYIKPSGNDKDANGLDDAYESVPGAGEGIRPADTDGDGTPDYLDRDADNDNVADSLEGHDKNHDSMPDVLATGTDSDGDGLDDGYEGINMNDGFIANDEINNPLNDLPNTDQDNEVDYRDADDDNDGIATRDEDLNRDGNPTNDDTDGDFVMNYLDMDDDNDGILTAVEGAGNFDNDGTPNYLDLDSDGDGLPDNIEAQNTLQYILPSFLDANRNGLDDAYETASSNNRGITPVDTDNDRSPDYLDSDADDDLVPDSIEGHDFNHDGRADVSPANRDTDNDGLDDAFEGDDVNNGYVANGSIINPSEDLPNRDNTDEVDFRDADDDNDGIPTREEDGNGDGDPTNDNCDEDYWPNYLDETPCNIVPTGFSPNGDGVNDTLIVPALSEYPNFTMQIYDRWGGKIWEYKRNGSLTPQWWDGYSQNSLTLQKGELMPAGTYFYVIEFNKDNRKRETGWVYLNK